MVGGVMLTAILAAPGQDTPPKPAPTSTALVTTYADGTSSYDLVSERFAWRWAPKFPLIDGARADRRALRAQARGSSMGTSRRSRSRSYISAPKRSSLKA